MTPGKGCWDVPGGFLRLADDPEGALVRECKREFGVTVRVCEPLGAVRDEFAGGSIAIFYRCEIESGEPRPADIVDEVAWFPLWTLPPIAFESVRQALDALGERLK